MGTLTGAVDAHTSELIDVALAEDVGAGDWTTLWTVDASTRARARIVAKAHGIVAGMAVAEAVFVRVEPMISANARSSDGTRVAPGEVVLDLIGPARGILTAERVALNFLQRLSGVATLTSRYVAAVRGTHARILDTRKTTPGLRALEKAAVLAGGGSNHRFGLHDMILIKENHITAAGGITAAVAAVRRENRAGLRIEVEVTNAAEVEEAVSAQVDRILFDNMSIEALRSSVELVRSQNKSTETEASGGVNLASVHDIAMTGVDFISVGALTHSVPALDLSLLIDR